MHDIKQIREAPDQFAAGLTKRKLSADLVAEILKLDEQRRKAQTDADGFMAKRNQLSKEVGKLKAAKDEAGAAALIEEVATLKQQIADLQALDSENGESLQALLSSLPNIPDDSVPVGDDEAANQELRRWGNPEKLIAHEKAKAHYEIGEALALMDFDQAAVMSGARFVVLKGVLAKLERALANMMLDIHTNEHGYTEIAPPLLVRDNAMFGTGQLPKFAEDLFQTKDGFWLIPTAEVSLTNLVQDKILDEGDLPLRYTAWTPCFRSEAGAAGRDTRGMIRLHQFSKVEMVSLTTSDNSDAELERMTKAAETILQRLELPYRVMALSSGDMGFSARKTYDLEVWLPSQNTYREISSCSNCGDFQARRMNARYKKPGQKGGLFMHSLNGSGLAVGRTLVAVLECGLQEDGTIKLPDALVPYMGGQKTIALS